jgi:hypothetical protein
MIEHFTSSGSRAMGLLNHANAELHCTHSMALVGSDNPIMFMGFAFDKVDPISRASAF